MTRFEPDRYYPTNAPELAVIATRGTLAQWRHRGYGPAIRAIRKPGAVPGRRVE